MLYSQENLKLNIGKCHFRCIGTTFFEEIVSCYGVEQDAHKAKHTDNDDPT